MRARRLVLSATISTLFALAAGTPASANIAWCMYDPPVKVVTPAGNNLTVNTYVYYSKDAKKLAPRVTADGGTVSNGTGGTTITVHVYVPPGSGTVHVVVTNQRYQVSEEQDGTGGSVMTFTLDVPND